MKIHLFDHSSDVTVVPAGQVVFNAGEPGDRMYAVVAGEVDILVHGKVVETVGPSQIFGEMALVEDRARTATAVVKSEAKLVAVDRTRFLCMVQQTPFFSLQVLTIVTDRLRRIMAEKL